MNPARFGGLKHVRNLLTDRALCKTYAVPLQLRSYARKSTLDQEDPPIKFTTSGAIHGIADIRRIQVDQTPWYQGVVVIGSLAIFLIYFCILREENDIDIELNRSLYDRIDGMEETNLQVARRYFLEQGKTDEVKKIDARLKELGATPL